MKKILFCFCFIIFFNNLKAQDITASPFYISFFKWFNIGDVPFDKQDGYFFSMLLKTNESGQIIAMEESKGMDSIFIKAIPSLNKHIDRNGLQEFNFKNSVLLLPVFVLNSTKGKYDDSEIKDLWSFKTGNILEDNKVHILPPAVIYYTTATGVINN